jgi:hypothetical protein
MYKPNVDIMGYIRGAHKEGELICDGFVFTQPGGRKNDRGEPIYGWNDTAAVRCAKCGERDEEHLYLGDVNEQFEKIEKEQRERMAKAAALRAGAGAPLSAKPAAPPQQQHEVWLLDDSSDPLSVASVAKRAPAPAPAPAATPVSGAGGGVAALSSEDFKAEVERMVRESLTPPMPAPAAPPPPELAERLAAMEAQLAAATAKLQQAGLA